MTHSIQSLPAALRAISASWGRRLPATQTERQAIIRALTRDERSGLSLLAAREAAEHAAAACKLARESRTRRRALARLGHEPGYSAAAQKPWHDRAVLPAGTPAERLHARRIAGVQRGVRVCLTDYARGDAPRVQFVDSLGACSIDLDKIEGWVEYSRRFGHRRGIVSATYRVAALPALEACPRVIDGLLTLGAVRAPAAEADDETIWQAVWARQGRGEPVREAGYVVARRCRSGMVYAHGSTVAAARGALTRRGATPAAAAVARWLDAVRASLDAGQLTGYDVPVTMRDARRAGLCEAGIRGWCGRHGLDADGETTVGRIVAITDQHAYVLAACLAAVRRQVRAGA